MDEGDEIEVTYESTGCFHSKRSTMNFKRQGKALSLKVDGNAPAIIITKATRIKSLDRHLILLRRHRNKGGCTTQTDLSYVFKEKGKAVHKEALSDGDCAIPDSLAALLDLVR